LQLPILWALATVSECQKPTAHINGESVCRAMARLSERVAKTKLLKGARVHDLRRTVTTWLREERLVSSDVCDQILHHARKGVNANHYTSARLKVNRATGVGRPGLSVAGRDATGSNVIPLSA
jgi:integrase